MRIEKPAASPSSSRKSVIALVVALGLAGLFFWLYQTSQKSAAPKEEAPVISFESVLPPLEIVNFTGKPEIFSAAEKNWLPLQRGVLFEWGQKIRTNAESEVDLRAADQVVLRLKSNSELERRSPADQDDADRYQIHLIRGLILGATEKKAETERWLQVSTPAVVASIRGTVFAVRAEEGDQNKSWVGVLRGVVDVNGTAANDQVTVKDLQRTETLIDGTLSQPQRVSRDEWDKMKEAYELIQKSAAQEAEQMDLSLEAGGLFTNVFDHGTFFTPKVGYAWRNFVKEENGKVYLEIEYDVFPRGSYVGMYMKVRDTDIANYEALQFKVHRISGTGYPDAFRIEVKSKGQILRAFTPKQFKKEWQTMQLPLRYEKSAPISEITFVFSHSQAGEHTRGALRFADIELIPKKSAEVPAEAPSEKTAASTEQAGPEEESAPAPTVPIQ